jgi:hypothetical protein
VCSVLELAGDVHEALGQVVERGVVRVDGSSLVRSKCWLHAALEAIASGCASSGTWRNRTSAPAFSPAWAIRSAMPWIVPVEE